jgi:glycerate 2-kinase
VTAARLTELYLEVAAAVDGARLVAEALAGERTARATHVLAIGKVAIPMFEGFTRVAGDPRAALVIAPDGEALARPGVRLLFSDHPQPTARSEAAARAALAFAHGLGPGDRLAVLLSGGGSALAAAPAAGLTLEDKRATVAAVARAGATIGELNTVRKHLSAVKGGQLALSCDAPVKVLALSDVVGSDPATIASGPFSADPTTFAQALALVQRFAPEAPAAARLRLERGAAGAERETPKPGDPRLAHVNYRVLAGPERVAAVAKEAIERAGLAADVLSRNTEDAVPTLAAAYAMRARRELDRGPRVLTGNGEPRIVVSGTGRGGRSTHLALLLAREIAGLPVAFLAAGTDRYDGSAGASGAVVDGGTWEKAREAGLDPAAALDRCDSASVLEAVGALVQGPGRSNLLDLHLMAIGS